MLKTPKYLQNEEKETKRKLQLRHFAAQCFGPKRCQFFLTLLELHGIVAVASQRCCYKFCSSTSSSIAFFTLKSCFLSVVKFAIFFCAHSFLACSCCFCSAAAKDFCMLCICVYISIYPIHPIVPLPNILFMHFLYLLSYNNVINCARFLLFYFKYPICIYLYAGQVDWCAGGAGVAINLCADKFN